MTTLPPRLAALAKRLNDTQTTAAGAVDVLWREEIEPLVCAVNGLMVAMKLGPYVDEAAAYTFAAQTLERLERTT